MDWKKKAISFFHQHINTKEISVKKIHQGYTNVSFLVEDTSGNKYQVRLNNNSITKRDNEKQALANSQNLREYIVYKENGDAIKKWIDGRHPTFSDFCQPRFCQSFYKAVNALHKKPTNKLLIFDPYEFFQPKVQPYLDKYRNKYLFLVKLHMDFKDKKDLVFSHNDLCLENIIVNNTQIRFIDFEWSRINKSWWDVANLLKELPQEEKEILPIGRAFGINNKQLLWEYMFICASFSYQWTFHMKSTKQILVYRKKMQRLIDCLYKKIKA